MANEVFWTDAGNYTAAELRKLIASIWVSPTNVTASGGVIVGLDVTVAGALSLSVSAGRAFVYDGTSDGAYLGYKSTSTTVAVTTNSGGSAARIDNVYALVMDPGSGVTAGELSFGIANNQAAIPAKSTYIGQIIVTTANVITVSPGSRQQVEVNTVTGRYALSTATTAYQAATDARLAALETSVSNWDMSVSTAWGWPTDQSQFGNWGHRSLVGGWCNATARTVLKSTGAPYPNQVSVGPPYLHVRARGANHIGEIVGRWRYLRSSGNGGPGSGAVAGEGSIIVFPAYVGADQALEHTLALDNGGVWYTGFSPTYDDAVYTSWSYAP